MNNAAAGQENRLKSGVWGGEHIRLEATDGGAQIEYDCAHSTIDQPVTLDSHGRFDVRGQFTRERGGPIRRGEAPSSSPVRYVGQVKGDALELSVTFVETGESAGTFQLTYGAAGQLMKCR